MRTMPFFLTNEEWYTVDAEDTDRGYKLTDKAPQEAIDSYNEFYGSTMALIDETEEDSRVYIFE